MKILIFSDSHGNTLNMKKAIKKHKDVYMVIHLGDILRDVFDLQRTFPELNIEFIKGNNDWNREIAENKVLDICDKKIFITHGHNFGVKSEYKRLVNRGKTLEVDAVLYGHTHQAEEFFIDGMMVLNPGTVGGQRFGEGATYCLLEIENDKKLKSKFFRISKK